MAIFDRNIVRTAQNTAQILALFLFVAVASVATAANLLAGFGVLPWLILSGSFGTVALEDLGIAVQVLFTLFAVSLCFFIPSNLRILKLERGHRNFSLTMQDVARAYALSHRADKEGEFSLSSEFDSVRERINHLRQHPDLAGLEPAVLEVAAQMSHESHELAAIYSDEKVARAKTFLKQRQQELETYKDQIALAQYTTSELKRWLGDLDAEDRIVAKQLDRLKRDLKEVLPPLGYAFGAEGLNHPNVVPMSSKGPEKVKDGL